jgi:hypothetical protein
MSLQVSGDFLGRSIRNRRAIDLSHFVDFRLPRCPWQGWLHGDVSRAVANCAKTLHFPASLAFRQFRRKRRISPHVVPCVWCKQWSLSLSNASCIRGTIRPASHLCENQATGECYGYSSRTKRHLPSFLHRRSPQFAFPATSSCLSILFHKYPPGFQTASSGCTLPFSSVARTAIEYFPGVFGVHGACHPRKE